MEFWDRGRPGVDPLPELSRRMHRKTSVRLLAALEAIERELMGDAKAKRRLKSAR
jgi:hypothetical protein